MAFGQRKASVGAPPMSVPHIDTRVLDGKRVVLFGPFATFSTKFLKNGSLWDLMSSTTTSNVMPMMHVGLDNFDLVKYLVSQVMLSEEDRFEALKEYYPQAKKEDWRLWQAGHCRSLWPRRLLKKARSQPSCQCAAMLITANTASK